MSWYALNQGETFLVDFYMILQLGPDSAVSLLQLGQVDRALILFLHFFAFSQFTHFDLSEKCVGVTQQK